MEVGKVLSNVDGFKLRHIFHILLFNTYIFAVVWMFVSAANSCVENLLLNMMVSGCGAFERWLGHRGEHHKNAISAFAKETSGNCLAPSAMLEHSERVPCLWTRKWRLTRFWLCQCLDLGLPIHSLQKWENTFLLFISHPVYDILF